jgi:hypothetical protein
MDHPLLDSGHRRTFVTGAVRDCAEGKGRFDLLSPIVILRDAIWYEKGATKYTARNWEQGMDLSVFVNSALRHTFRYLAGYRQPTDEDHLAAARFNLAGAMHVEEMIRRGLLPLELDDLPSYRVPPLVSGETDAP